jgi:hypothetical protein
MNFLRKYSWSITGMIIGALGGFLYWRYVGCLSGTCMITSVWHHSTAYGAMLGMLSATSVKDLVHKKQSGEKPES